MTGMNIDPEFYGETWKVNSETKCAEISSPSTEKCENEVCVTPVYVAFTRQHGHVKLHLKS